MGVTVEIISSAAKTDAPKPVKGQTVTVHCTGMLELPGQPLKKFWSTHDTNEPFSFAIGLGSVIKGWDEGVLQMQKGEKSRLHMTADYGYGAKGFPTWGIPENAPLCFEIELLEIN
jgi:peptidylprolyl isomerase